MQGQWASAYVEGCATDYAIARLHLSLFGSKIIVIQYQLRHSNVIMSKKRNALTLRHKVALINEAYVGKSCRHLAVQFNIRRTHATSINTRKAELVLEYDQNI